VRAHRPRPLVADRTTEVGRAGATKSIRSAYEASSASLERTCFNPLASQARQELLLERATCECGVYRYGMAVNDIDGVTYLVVRLRSRSR
jgi:hypothetical protein